MQRGPSPKPCGFHRYLPAGSRVGEKTNRTGGEAFGLASPLAKLAGRLAQVFRSRSATSSAVSWARSSSLTAPAPGGLGSGFRGTTTAGTAGESATRFVACPWSLWSLELASTGGLELGLEATIFAVVGGLEPSPVSDVPVDGAGSVAPAPVCEGEPGLWTAGASVEAGETAGEWSARLPAPPPRAPPDWRRFPDVSVVPIEASVGLFAAMLGPIFGPVWRLGAAALSSPMIALPLLASPEWPFTPMSRPEIGHSRGACSETSEIKATTAAMIRAVLETAPAR
jgi:hypothetical protein